MSIPLKLYYPVYPYVKYQTFGDSQACTEDNNKPLSQRKITGKIWKLVCPVGYVELYPLMGMKGHTGEDMYGAHGAPCYYAGPDGVVEEIETELARGLGVGVISDEKFDCEGGTYHVKTRYWHFMDFAVKIGDKVKTGDLLGHCDNTGFSSGDHLHFELKPVEYNTPGNYPKYNNVFQHNEYFGSIDPAKYWTGEYAKKPDIIPIVRDLYFGCKGDDVATLQKILIKYGFMQDFPEPKGYFGPKTKAAVQNFQKYFVISPILGYVGKKTREALSIL